MRLGGLPGQGRRPLIADHRGIAVAAPAKLNLWLHVVGRRRDGYHLLDSLVAFADVCDTVSVAPAETLSLTVAGPFAPALSATLAAAGGENLVLRAARLLAQTAGVAPRARIRLIKALPVAAGIGGGSADAAAALRGLNRLWSLGRSDAELARLALPLGADLPVCVHRRPMLVTGIGERLAPAPPLPPAGLLLVNPGVPVATPAVFARRTGPFSPPAGVTAEDLAAARDARDLADLLGARGNDLEHAAIALAPAIAEALARLTAAPGCLLARLSGSGATCFGLFPDKAAAAAAGNTIARGRPDWWVTATGFRDRRRG